MTQKDSGEEKTGIIEDLIKWLLEASIPVEMLEALVLKMMESAPIQECAQHGACGQEGKAMSSSILIEYETACNGVSVNMESNISGPPEIGAVALMEAICVLLCAKHTHISKTRLFQRLVQVLSEMDIMHAVVVPVDMGTPMN